MSTNANKHELENTEVSGTLNKPWPVDGIMADQVDLASHKGVQDGPLKLGYSMRNAQAMEKLAFDLMAGVIGAPKRAEIRLLDRDQVCRCPGDIRPSLGERQCSANEQRQRGPLVMQQMDSFIM